MASTGGQLPRGLHAMRSFRRVLADAAAASPAAPIVAPMKRPPKPGSSCALHCTALIQVEDFGGALHKACIQIVPAWSAALKSLWG